MTIFISGGAKNGKSTLAQELAVQLAKGSSLYYVATMIPADEEDRDRIRRHIADRDGMGFETLECGRDILSCLENADREGTFLLDSATALLLNELFPDPTSCGMDDAAPRRCAEGLCEFARRVKNAVIVSDYIYSDAALYDEVTETYRRGLAYVDRCLAKVCDTVAEVSCGNVILHKGVLPE
ncbi:MAG: bifunctional adenosylcobinamide kinase/adenosylcobinamide-phosphate guanylyltransferase [Oscillospiraceae bacterium]|nr:bifunctional adenosylcobinamide kinase/adenosylcobinamide-phosphate guanylyltransferase [Oscillospiraceae bacterium]